MKTWTWIKIVAALALALAVSAGTASARENYSWKTFKGNLDASGIDELIHGSVFVGYLKAAERPGEKHRGAPLIIASDSKGNTYRCAWWGGKNGHELDKYVRRGDTFTQANRIRLDRIAIADLRVTKSRGGVIPIYDSTNGAFKTFVFHKRRWWEDETGHLQRHIPAVTYELCPEFPKASTLGMKVNPHQTAKLYTEMMKQHPGVRILRPDLITEDTKVTWKRGEPEPPLTRGYWNAFSEHPCFGCNKGK